MALRLTKTFPFLEFSRKSFIVARDSSSVGGRNLLYLTGSDRDVTNNSIVMSAVAFAMRNVNSARVVVRSESEDGWKVVPNHPCPALIRAPQSMIPADERSHLTEAKMNAGIAFSLMLEGDAYVHKLRNSRGQVVGLDYLPHTAVDVVPRRSATGVVEFYRVRTSSGQADIDPRDMVHFRNGLDPFNPCKGLSPLKSVLRHVMTDNEIAVYSHAIVKAPVPGMLVSPKDSSAVLDRADADFLREQMTASLAGERAGGVLVPTFPADVSPLRFSPDQMAIDKLNRLPEERITSVLGIPAVVLGLGAGLDRSTYNNMAEARKAAYEEFLVPMWRDMSESWGLSLLPDFGSRPGETLHYDTSEITILREDEDKVHERARKDFESNLINRAEGRVMIGQKPGPGDEMIYAYMLKPSPPAPAGLPQGTRDAGKARRDAESR